MTEVDIEQLFADRDQIFKEGTNKILAAMSNTIEAIIEFLSEDMQIKNGDVSWQDLTLHEDMVMIIGVVAYAPGSSFVTQTGKVVEVTDQTEDYFRRLLRIGLPLKMVREGKKEDVVQYLKDSQARALANEQELQEILQQLGQNQELEKTDTVNTSLEFDLDELTEDQRKALEMFNKFGK